MMVTDEYVNKSLDKCSAESRRQGGSGMTIDEYVAQLVAASKPLTPEQIEGAARILAGVESEQVAA